MYCSYLIRKSAVTTAATTTTTTTFLPDTSKLLLLSSTGEGRGEEGEGYKYCGLGSWFGGSSSPSFLFPEIPCNDTTTTTLLTLDCGELVASIITTTIMTGQNNHYNNNSNHNNNINNHAVVAEREAELIALQSAFDEYIASSRELEEELDAELSKMRK